MDTDYGTPAAHGAVADDFEAIEGAVMETVRGRWFLREFARRRRAEQTAKILASIDRLEARLLGLDARSRGDSERIARALREIADTLSGAPPRDEGVYIANSARRLPPPRPSEPSDDLETRMAALTGLDSLDVEAKFRLFG